MARPRPHATQGRGTLRRRMKNAARSEPESPLPASPLLCVSAEPRRAPLALPVGMVLGECMRRVDVGAAAHPCVPCRSRIAVRPTPWRYVSPAERGAQVGDVECRACSCVSLRGWKRPVKTRRIRCSRLPPLGRVPTSLQPVDLWRPQAQLRAGECGERGAPLCELTTRVTVGVVTRA
jgi:hypothetical protein|eukprot:6231028-Prymnesium_polylepis.1